MGPPELPSQQNEGIGYPRPPTLAERDLQGWCKAKFAPPDQRDDSILTVQQCCWTGSQIANAEHLTYIWCRAVPVSPFGDYTDTAYSRLLKEPIPIMQPIMTPIMRG